MDESFINPALSETCANTRTIGKRSEVNKKRWSATCYRPAFPSGLSEFRVLNIPVDWLVDYTIVEIQHWSRLQNGPRRWLFLNTHFNLLL